MCGPNSEECVRPVQLVWGTSDRLIYGKPGR
jgi:hypothetical protein